MVGSNSPPKNRSNDNDEIQPATANGLAADSSSSFAGNTVGIRRRRRDPENDVPAFDAIDDAEQEE